MKSDAHKVGLETKAKIVTSAWNGIDCEAKLKNNGEIVTDMKFDALKVSSFDKMMHESARES